MFRSIQLQQFLISFIHWFFVSWLHQCYFLMSLKQSLYFHLQSKVNKNINTNHRKGGALTEQAINMNVNYRMDDGVNS